MNDKQMTKKYRMGKSYGILTFIQIFLLAAAIVAAIAYLYIGNDLVTKISVACMFIATLFTLAYCVIGFRKGGRYYRSMVLMYMIATVLYSIAAVASSSGAIDGFSGLIPLIADFFTIALLSVLISLNRMGAEKYTVCSKLYTVVVVWRLVVFVVDLITYSFSGAPGAFNPYFFMSLIVAASIALCWQINYKRERIDDVSFEKVPPEVVEKIKERPDAAEKFMDIIHCADGPVSEEVNAMTEKIRVVTSAYFDKYDAELGLPAGTLATIMAKSRVYNESLDSFTDALKPKCEAIARHGVAVIREIQDEEDED